MKSSTTSFLLMTAMTKEQFDAGSDAKLTADTRPSDVAGSEPPSSKSRTFGSHNANVIFAGIAVLLAGIFGILELSYRHTDKATEAITYRLNTLQTSQHDLGERISRLEVQTDKRFDRVENRLDRVETKIDQMEAKFEKRFEQMENRFVQVETKIGQVETKIDQLTDAILKRAR